MQTMIQILIADHKPQAPAEGEMQILKSAGYDCHIEPCGAEALEIFHAGKCQILIANPDLPELSIFDALSHLTDRTRNIPVILVTCNPNMQTARRAMRLPPIVDYLTKPVTPEALLAAVKEGFRLRQAYQAFKESIGHLRACSSAIEKLDETLAQAPRFIMMEAEASYQRKRPLPPGRQEPELRMALLETVIVLSKTKNAFKSKELGDLRHKLESLLHELPE